MSRRSEWYLAVIVVVLSALLIPLIYLQEARVRSLGNNSFLAELQSLLPGLQKSADPADLAIRRVFSLIGADKPLTAADMPRLQQALVEQIGAEARFVICDSQLATYTARGFAAEEVSDWLMFFKFYQKIYPYCPLPTQVERILSRCFDSDFSANYLPDFINSYVGSFAGSKGVVIVGDLMNPEMVKDCHSRRSWVAEGVEYYDSNRFGSCMIFLPVSLYSDIDWYRQHQNLSSIIGSSESICGNIASVSADLQPRDPELSAVFARQASEKPNGAFISGKYACCFFKLPFLSADGKDLQIFSVLLRRLPEVPLAYGSIASTIAIIFAMLLLAMMAINEAFEHCFFSLRIAQYFFMLSLATCTIPVIALALQAVSQYRMQSLQHDAEVYDQFEEKLVGIEKEYQSKLSDMLTAVNLFQTQCSGLASYSVDQLESMTPPLYDHGVGRLITCDRSGHIDVIKVRATDSDEDESFPEAIEYLKGLVQFIQRSLKFVTDEKTVRVADALVGESIIEAMGADAVYQMALQHGRLLTFKMERGAIWSISFFQNDSNGLPVRFYLYIINRDLFQETLTNQWQARKYSTGEILLFSGQNSAYLEQLMPTWLESRPEFITVLKSITASGGHVKARINSRGREYHCAGRRFKDIDWSCLVVKPVDGEYGESSVIVWLLLATIAYLMVLLLFISRYFTRIFITPVKELTGSLSEMAEGNYDLRLQGTSHDEIGQMRESFNLMAASLKEKEFLNRFLSDIARDAISGQTATHATKVEGSILFSDIRDFTTLTEQLPPEEIVAMLNDYMTRMEEAIEANSGAVEKFIGDAVMAVFLPVHGQPHTALRAAAAAEMMMDALRQMNKERGNKKLFTIKIGVGIATGPLLMGVVGNQHGRRDYTVTGRTVLQAAAMEKLTRYAIGQKIVFCSRSSEFIVLSGERMIKVETGSGKITGFELA